MWNPSCFFPGLQVLGFKRSDLIFKALHYNVRYIFGLGYEQIRLKLQKKKDIVEPGHKFFLSGSTSFDSLKLLDGIVRVFHQFIAVRYWFEQTWALMAGIYKISFCWVFFTLISDWGRGGGEVAWYKGYLRVWSRGVFFCNCDS